MVQGRLARLQRLLLLAHARHPHVLSQLGASRRNQRPGAQVDWLSIACPRPFTTLPSALTRPALHHTPYMYTRFDALATWGSSLCLLCSCFTSHELQSLPHVYCHLMYVLWGIYSPHATLYHLQGPKTQKKSFCLSTLCAAVLHRPRTTAMSEGR